jgi:hypothetical protein
MANSGPTLNPTYNNLLKSWAKQGHPCDPECEECSCDLTGKQVHDVGTGWLCTECMEKENMYDVSETEEEEEFFRFGSRQSRGYEDFHSDG